MNKNFVILLFFIVTLSLVKVGAGADEEHIHGIHEEEKDIEEGPLTEFQEFCEKQARQRKAPGDVGEECGRTDPREFHEDDTRILFSLFVIILWGAIVRTCLRAWKIKLPYTVVMMVSGLFVGLISKYTCYSLYTFTAIARTKPEIILFTFLPVLIFETAFGISSHTFMRAISQILLTALPGMLIATFLTAVICYEFFSEYEWTILEAAFFGSIISATDPVAVVAILKELGASEMLSVLIDGESLLNDGVAILLFEIFKELLEAKHGEQVSTGKMVLKIGLQFLQIAVGGPIFGYIVAKISIFSLSRVFNDAIVEITITLVSTYMTYFVGEVYFGVSGVMAVVSLGITMSSEKTCISPEAEHDVHEFWEMLGHIANTVLFFICGIVITETALTNITWHDLWYLILLYFALNLIRFVMLLFLSPLLARCGYGLTWQNLLVMMWGGLRGAVGICLALQVFQDNNFCSHVNLGPKILFQTAGIVLLTLLVNGTTTSYLLNILKLTEISIGRLEEMQNAMRQITEAQQKGLQRLRHDRFQSDSNWPIVEKFTTIVNPYQKATIKAFETHDNTSLLSIKEATTDHITECPECLNLVKNEPTAAEYKVLTEEARLRIVKAMKISYWSQFEQGILSEDAVQLLVGIAEIIADKPLYLIHTKDINKYWQIRGLFPWLKAQIMDKFVHKTPELPPCPRLKCRKPFWKLATSDWFEGVIILIVILNMIPAIWEFTNDINSGSTCKMDDSDEKKTFRIINIFFITIYMAEFVIKIVGRGFLDYFKSSWNYVDIIVLIVSIVDISFSYIPCKPVSHHSISGTNFTKILKILRLVRITRAIRLIKPLIPAIQNFIHIQINHQLFLGYDMATGFITSIDDVVKFLPQMIENQKVLKKLKKHLERERLITVREMGLLQKDHAGIAIAVKTRHASRAVLNRMRSALYELKVDGLLDEKENNLLSVILEEKMKKLSLSPAYINPCSPESLLQNLNWTIGNQDLKDFIIRNATLLNFAYGETIMKIGDPPNGVYIIVNGLVKITFEPTPDIAEERRLYGVIPNCDIFKDMLFESVMEDFVSTGAVLGESSILTKRPRASNVTCETNVVVHHVPQSVMEEALETFNDTFDSLEERMWRSCGMRRGAPLLQCEPIYQNWSIDKIHVHLDKSAVPIGEPFSTITIPEYIAEVILIEGKVLDLHTNETYTAPCVLPRSCNKFVGVENSYTVNRVLVVAFDNIDLAHILENEKPADRELRKCIMKAMDIRRSTPSDEQEDQTLLRQRRYSVALNFGVRQKHKKKILRNQESEDLSQIRALRRLGIKQTIGNDEESKVDTFSKK